MFRLRQRPERLTLLSLLFVLGTTLTVSSTVDRQPTHAQRDAGATSTVEVTRFVPAVRVGDTRLFRLAFNYNFPKRTRVVVVGFGAVPAKGNLSYLTPDTRLVFEDTAGAILKQVELTTTGIPEGSASKMPTPEDFPPEGKNYARAGILSREHCDAVLNEFFDSGYLPDIGKDVSVYTTTYQNIPNPPKGKVARYALRITNPLTSVDNSGRSAFRVQLAVKEKGILSKDDAQTISGDTAAAADKLREEIAKRLSQ